MEFQPSKSIKRKVTTRVVVTLAITVIVLSVVNLLYMSSRVISEQETELKLAAQLSASRIDHWTVNMEDIAEGVADSLNALDTIDEETCKSILNQIAWTHGDLYYAYVATEDGNMYMARGVEYPKDLDPTTRDWYIKTKAAGHTIVTNPYISASNPDVMLVTVATPVYHGTKMVGAVGVDADITTINNFMESIDFQNGAYGFLIDTDRNIVAHKNEEYLPTVDNSTSVDDVMPELSDIVTTPDSGVVISRDYNNVAMVYYTMRLYESKWVVCVAYPQNNILKIIERGVRICVLIAIFCIFSAAGYMTLKINKTLEPIEKINPAINRLRKGDFKARIDITNEPDELGMLQNNMAELIQELSTAIGSMKHVLSEMEKGNLIVDNVPEYPGDFNEISVAINSIREHFNDIISDIQFSAINLQSFAMGINETSDLEEMRAVFEELSAEANELMEKTSKFITMPNTQDSKDM